MSLETSNLEFDGYRLDRDQKILLLDEKPVPLAPKAIDLLSVLLENRGQIVSKDELMQSVWKDSFVEDSNLTFTISILRKTLGSKKYIETVPKRGYRFVARTEETKAQDLEVDANEVDQVDTQNARWQYVTVGILALFVVSLAALGFGLYRNSIQPPTQATQGNVTVERLTSSGNVRFAAAEPSGKYVAYVEEEGKQQSFWLKNVANGSNLRIALPKEIQRVTSFSFAPDGDSIYFGAGSTLYSVPIFGGATIKVAENYIGGDQSNAVTFSPDSKMLAFFRTLANATHDVALVVANVDGSGEQNIAVSKRPDVFLRSASWSPDGRTIACVALSNTGLQRIALINVNERSTDYVPKYEASWIQQVAWRHHGLGLFAVTGNDSELGSQLWSVDLDGKSTRLSTGTNIQNLSLTVDPTKILAVRAEQEANLWIGESANLDASKQITSGSQRFDGVYAISWTTDGKIFYESSPSGRPEVWSVDKDGQNARQISTEIGMLAVSGDGRSIFTQFDDGTGLGLFRFDTGSRERVRITSGSDVYPSLSRDGKLILFNRYADDVNIWKYSTETGETAKVTDLSGFASYPSVSPDGKMVAFFHNGAKGGEPPMVKIASTETGEVLRQFAAETGLPKGDGSVALRWTPDSKAIEYAVHKLRFSNLWRQPLSDEKPSKITNFTSGLIFNFMPSLDGTHYAFSKGTYDRDVVVISMPE